MSAAPNSHHRQCNPFCLNRSKTDNPSTRGPSQTSKKRQDEPKSLSNITPVLYPRKPYNGTTYCEAHTNTYVVVVSSTLNAAVSSFLDDCLAAVQREIARGSTGLIPSGGWRQLGRNALSMVVYSEDAYQTTYGMLQSAIQALINWMSNEDIGFRTGSFTIWHGEHQVGRGSING